MPDAEPQEIAVFIESLATARVWTPDELGAVAQLLAESTDENEAALLKKLIMSGFYGTQRMQKGDQPVTAAGSGEGVFSVVAGPRRRRIHAPRRSR